VLCYSVHKASHVPQQQPSSASGLQQCMPAIDVPLLVGESVDQIGMMDSDELVPSLPVCLHHSYFFFSQSVLTVYTALMLSC